MHKTVILVVAATLTLGAVAEGQSPRDRAPRGSQGRDRDNREEQTERFTRTLKVGANGEIHLANVAGDITIERGGGSEASVEVVKVARGRTADDAREMLGLVPVEIVERGTRAEVKTRYPQGEEFRRNNRRNINVSVSYALTAPPGTRVIANSVSGNISARDIKGDLNLESVSGTIRVGNGGRVGALKSISGDVEVHDTEADSEIAASSVSGTVTLRNVKSRAATIDSISGGVVLHDVACDRVEAQAISGDVEFTGSLARNGRYELTSHSGSVRVFVAASSGFEVEATSFSGEVRTDIPLKSRSTENNRRHNRTLRGVYGDGSAVLELTTFSGNIILGKR